MSPNAKTNEYALPFFGFVYHLRDEGILHGLTDVLDFYRGIQKGLVKNLDDLFLLGRLCFIRKVSAYDRYYRVFQSYFRGIELPPVAEGDPELLQTKAFADWLAQAMKTGELQHRDLWRLTREELMRKFWETVKAQMEAHHGGSRWVGTGGSSPFGHSGMATPGVRVHGSSQNRSALKVFGDRRYVNYDADQTLSHENLSQALASLKHLKPVGPYTQLDIDETIRETARNGGEIELIFDREERDKLRLFVFFDNGGSSMAPFVHLTRLLFSKMKRFKDFRAFYFHNTIFGHVYTDPQRRKRHSLDKILTQSPETHIFIVGDACMAPDELMGSYGSLTYDDTDAYPSFNYLKRLEKRFPHAVWLNPIPKHQWQHVHGAWTLNKIREVFHMEDLTLGGIRQAVEYMDRQKH